MPPRQRRTPALLLLALPAADDKDAPRGTGRLQDAAGQVIARVWRYLLAVLPLDRDAVPARKGAARILLGQDNTQPGKLPGSRCRRQGQLHGFKTRRQRRRGEHL